jgi:DNA invertase Pin-like site-specific DNA recombinase
MDQYCLYLRKSRKDDEAEARGEGETLERHEKTLMELAKRQNLTVTHIYREVVSGDTIAARPAMRRLLSEVGRGVWAGVIVMEVERLARGDTSDQGAVAKMFKYSDTKIITPTKSYDPCNEFDEEYFEFSLFMSRREYKIITRRMQRGRLASIKEGKYVAGRPPYGYNRVRLEGQRGWTLEEHPEQADIIRMIFDLYTRGKLSDDGTYERQGTGLIAKKLNQMGVPAQKGGVWVPSSIRDILINPVYIGKVRWNWRPNIKKMVDGEVTTERPRAKTEDCILVDALHDGIIEPCVFEAAQKYMRANPPRPIGERGVLKNPLAGLVYCGKCGRSMQRRPYTGKGHPDTLLCQTSDCSNVSVHLHLVETKLLGALAEWIGGYKLQWDAEGQNKAVGSKSTELDVKRKELLKTKKEIDTLKVQLSKTHDLLEQGIYDTDTFLDRAKEIGERIGQARERCRILDDELRAIETREESRGCTVPKAERLPEVYGEMDSPAAKNELLKGVLEKVVYVKERKGRWHNRQDDFELILFPKIPGANK